jgi:hypothetical protein
VIRKYLAIVFAVSLFAAACGTTATSAPNGSAAPAASTTAAATAASAAPAVSVAPPAAGDGPALCAFLTSEIPALEKAGSTAGAVSVLAIDYADWIQLDSSRMLPDASVMDTLSTASCPDVRTKVLKLIGSDTFANGL